MQLLSLVEGEELGLAVEPAACAATDPWIPRIRRVRLPYDDYDAARIEVTAGPAETGAPAEPPAIEVLDLRGWIGGSRVVLRAADGAVSSTVELGAERARVRVPGPAPDREERRQSFAALTVTAALLLGRRERCLLHAAAAVSPDGGAWLLVGDSHAGKSTSCANLVRAGWDYLADDQVVIRRRDGGGFHAEGWPRAFNLDSGFFEGRATGRRTPVDAASLRPEAWRRSAPVAGLLFPRVSGDRTTALVPATAAEALEALIRQSPWLLADRDAAPALLALLEELAGLPAYRLRLGADVLTSPARLAAVIGSPARGPFPKQ